MQIPNRILLNYRESFFQAVSNSSWANEGYLVAAEIIQDDELLSELECLSIAFGIIQLDITDIDALNIVTTQSTSSSALQAFPYSAAIMKRPE